ncbi:MAG: hypothetical protein LBU32_12135 [Clostridiales bacterium]|jgi:hypothetical protein|nr:hypothetical protein [Clostridiales bacterium]
MVHFIYQCAHWDSSEPCWIMDAQSNAQILAMDSTTAYAKNLALVTKMFHFLLLGIIYALKQIIVSTDMSKEIKIKYHQTKL